MPSTAMLRVRPSISTQYMLRRGPAQQGSTAMSSEAQHRMLSKAQHSEAQHSNAQRHYNYATDSQLRASDPFACKGSQPINTGQLPRS